MTADELRALQAPHKAKYKENPAAAQYVISITGTVEGDDVRCRVLSPRGPIDAGLHAATGGDGSLACSADMLLEALVGCAGVTMKAVATALGHRPQEGNHHRHGRPRFPRHARRRQRSPRRPHRHPLGIRRRCRVRLANRSIN